MNLHPNKLPRGLTLLLVSLAAWSTPSVAHAQAAPTGVTPAVLAKYDVNRNGVLDPAELAARTADEARAASAVSSAAAPAEDKAIELSPFQVSAESDRGYLASNTLAGTRMNSRLEDLANSISVVTRQQLE